MIGPASRQGLDTASFSRSVALNRGSLAMPRLFHVSHTISPALFKKRGKKSNVGTRDRLFSFCFVSFFSFFFFYEACQQGNFHDTHCTCPPRESTVSQSYRNSQKLKMHFCWDTVKKFNIASLTHFLYPMKCNVNCKKSSWKTCPSKRTEEEIR